MNGGRQELTPDEEKRVKFFKDRLDLAKRAHKHHEQYWKRMEDVYLGTTELPSEVTTNFQSRLQIKWAWQRWESVAPKIMDPEPRLEFKPVEITDQKISDILKVLTKQQFTQDQFVSKQSSAIHDGGIKGISVWKVLWHQREETLQVRKAQTIQERALGVPIQFEETTVIVENRPTVQYVDPYDFFWDPSATSDATMRYCFHRIYLSKAELLERGARGIYRDVELACADDEDAGQRSKLENPEEAESRRQGKYAVYEAWFNDGSRMVMCNNVLLLDGPHPYHHKTIPFVVWCTQPIEVSLVGRSEMESVEDLQIAIWIKDNQRIEAVNFALYNIIIADPTIPDINNLKLHPGKIIKAGMGQRIEQWVIDPNTAAAFQESESYLSAMDAMTGYNAVIAGSDPSGMDRVAATVGSIVQEEGNIRMAMKKLQFRLAIARVAKMWVQLNHQYLSEYELHRILGDEALDYRPIPPEEIPMFLDVLPEAMSEAIGKMQERSSLLELLNIMGTLHGTQMLDGSYFDLKALLSSTLKSYDKEPAQSFTFTPPPVQNPVSVPPVDPAMPVENADMTSDMAQVMQQ